MIPYLNPKEFKGNGKPDEEFIVTWEIALSARNFVKAAELAREIQRDENSMATCFVVSKPGTQEAKIVDFVEESTLENPDTPD